MEWADRLQDLTGWREPRWERGWTETETELGTSLPDDFKELFARFGPGSFADYLLLLPSTGPSSMLKWHRLNLGSQSNPEEEFEEEDIMFGPHGVFGERSQRRGVLQWGQAGAPEGHFFWLADVEVDPNEWPILAKAGMYYGEEWERFDMTASEFVYRVLTEGDSMIFALKESVLERPRTFVPFEGYREEF